jgi:hypothetical protein
MRTQNLAHRAGFGVAALVTGSILGVSPAAMAQTGGRDAPVGSAAARGIIADVSATSARNAWAVGFTGPLIASRALIEHWNGAGWKAVASPALKGKILYSVTATSRRSAWAVGFTDSAVSNKTVILRWNGSAWKQLPSRGGRLYWAVGYSATTGRTLILHWNGSAWS